ncbi:MAG TPA: response regulator [Anaeromyxobacteraceae bacterium]|nr:response regulator [Anaeromyxobacteraceae bacterium]
MQGLLAGKRFLVVDENADVAALVADAAARFGAETIACANGRDALAAVAQGGIDAALIDLPLGDVRGSEVLRAFGTAKVPVVAVSGVYRGPRAAEDVRRLGAREFFEKPFEVEEAVRTMARLLGIRLPRLGALRDEVTGSLPLQGAPPRVDAVEAALQPALDTVIAAPARAATPMLALAAPLPETLPAHEAPAPDEPPPRTGDLAKVSVPRLLVALHQAQATGALTVIRGPVKKILCVERGVPVYAASNVGTERFGSICIRRGVVTAERLEALRKASPGAGSGALLVGCGLMDASRRAEIIAGQIKAILWSMFEWREGTYEFQLARPPEPRVAVSLQMGDLILEGMLRASTLPVLQAELPLGANLAPSPDPAFELYALGLRPNEAHLLSLADGTKSVRDLVSLSAMSERDTLAFLQACRVMRVLDEVERVLASTRRMGFM